LSALIVYHLGVSGTRRKKSVYAAALASCSFSVAQFVLHSSTKTTVIAGNLRLKPFGIRIFVIIRPRAAQSAIYCHYSEC
ncbi:MAG: hypothetical protein ACXVIS_10605, partial [Halobacteriota archaeon]